jgi:hypothetical protein
MEPSEKPVKEKVVKEKPVIEKPVKEKPVKEKPVKEKPVKEKVVKEKKDKNKEKEKEKNNILDIPNLDIPELDIPNDTLTRKTVSQSSLDRFIESKDPNIKELRIELLLEGVFDLSVLKKFPRLENLVFIEGKITRIKNIPEGIKRIWCNHNELESIDLPVSIIKIELTYNKLKTISFTKNILLEDINISNNFFHTLEKLPLSLKRLQCSSNQLVSVDMNSLENLNTFICNDNRAFLYITGHQDNIKKCIFPKQYELKKKSQPKYKEQVELFFSKKQDYEKKIKNQRQIPKCPVCKQKQGFLFIISEKQYKATCKAKCNWNITIEREKYEPLTEVIDYFEKDSKEFEQKMIDLKMKTLFQHLSNTEGTQRSKELIEAIETNQDFLKKYQEKHKEMYFSNDKNIYETNCNAQMQRQLEQLETNLEMKDIVQIQKEIHRIAQLQFENRYPSKSVFENPQETMKVYPNYYIMLNEFPLESLEINI